MCVKSPFPGLSVPFQNLCLTHLHLAGESALLLNPHSAKCYLLFLQAVRLKWKSSEDSCLNSIKDSDFDLLPFLTFCICSTISFLGCLIYYVQCKRSRLLICILDSRLVGLTYQTNILLGIKCS